MALPAWLEPRWVQDREDDAVPSEQLRSSWWHLMHVLSRTVRQVPEPLSFWVTEHSVTAEWPWISVTLNTEEAPALLVVWDAVAEGQTVYRLDEMEAFAQLFLNGIHSSMQSGLVRIRERQGERRASLCREVKVLVFRPTEGHKDWVRPEEASLLHHACLATAVEQHQPQPPFTPLVPNGSGWQSLRPEVWHGPNGTTEYTLELR